MLTTSYAPDSAKIKPPHGSPAGSAGSNKSGDNRQPKLNLNWTSKPTIVALVGLPARGKTFIGNRLSRYLNWVGLNTRVFNVGMYRRRDSAGIQGAEFFNDNNKAAKELRLKWRSEALADVVSWFNDDNGQIAIYDATNVERQARNFLCEYALKNEYKLFFVESECNDPKVVNSTVREVNDF